MGWMALSLRKMALKQKINSMEQRLVQISADLQAQYNASSYAQQALGVEKSQAKANMMLTFENNSKVLQNQYGSATDNASMVKYQQDLQQQQLSLQYSQMLQESIFSAKEQAMQETINDEETRLELEQEQIETQLEAARAEYKALDEACSQDIQDGAIKLV